jgi:TrmH family RNA methyltransferase
LPFTFHFLLLLLPMLVEKIVSKQNPLVKRFRRVRLGNETHHVFIEGSRLIDDALHAGVHFESVAFTATFEASERGGQLIEELTQVRCRGAVITQPILEAIADTESPQGIVAIVSRPYYELADLFTEATPLLVIANGLQDPGNLGSIIRTAEAAGASGLITTRATVSPYNLKALRASMGSAFRLPIVAHASEDAIVQMCGEHQVKLIATKATIEPVLEDAARAPKVLNHTEADLTVPIAFVLGREASGVSAGLMAHTDTFVHIPMAVGIESLNVAAAAAILLYEAARQRQFQFPLSR